MKQNNSKPWFQKKFRSLQSFIKYVLIYVGESVDSFKYYIHDRISLM
jgi:hypothetical protein